MFGALIRRRGQSGRDDDAFESATFSLSTEVPRPIEARSESRHPAILPVAKLSNPDFQCLCRVRNISAGGISAEATGLPPPAETELEVEFNSDRRVRGRVVWTRGSCLGIRFAENVDLRELLSDRRPRGGYAPRPPRLEVTCGATVRIGGLYHRVQVCDISLGGIKVDIGNRDCVGKAATVTLESFRPVKGRVCWHRGGQAGIVFDRALAFDELAHWLGQRVEVASARTGAWDRARR